MAITGFNTVHEHLISIITDIDVSIDKQRPFTCTEDGSGYVEDTEEVGEGERLFKIVTDADAYDAGYTGYPGEMVRANFQVEVRYNDGDKAKRIQKAGVDSGLINKAILLPNNWGDFSEVGISTILAPTQDDVTKEPDPDDPETLILKMIFRVEYLELN